MRTLNLGAGYDRWGTDKIDILPLQPDILIFDLNSNKPLPYKDNTFDEIRLHSTITLLTNPQFILDECYRVLKRGGIKNNNKQQ